ncbi:MAG: hypothetical protein IPL46_10630 [Saprospiraceae bacterium]|nr:hypothetical protein [Saprospiraceae bacterium]
MKSYELKHVRITIEDFVCEVTFSDTKRNTGRPFEDEHYIMFQYYEDDDYESESNFCYIESDDLSITGHYKKLNAKLFRDMLLSILKSMHRSPLSLKLRIQNISN